MEKQAVETLVREYLKDTDYELITLNISAGNDILIEIDRLAGVDVDFCAALNRYLVEQIEAYLQLLPEGKRDFDYSLEVGSVSLTAPFKTKMQYEKNLGHDVEVLVCTTGQSTKYKGQLVSVDEETFSVDVEEKVKVKTDSGKVKTTKQTVTHTWRYDEVKYTCYDLKF